MNLISLIDRIPFGHSAGKGYWLYRNIPPGFFQKLEEDNFKKTVRYVYRHSRFYRRRFDELNIRPEKIRRPEDLGDFFTTAEDLRNFTEEFVCARPDTAYESTGTTSKRTKRVYFSRGEIQDAGWAGAVGLWGVGVRPEDRIASAFDYSFWVSGPVLQASSQVLGSFHVEAGKIPPEEFYDRLSDYGISVIVSDPSWILALSEIAQKRGVWPVKLLIGGGENMTEQTRRFIERVWNADMLLSYGQTEAFGAIGMETRAKDGYHLNDFHNFFEIVHSDKDGYGELVYTTLNRRVMPLVRYKSGDITRFLDSYPPQSAADRNSHGNKDKLPGRRIAKLKGRVNEWVATAMGNIAPWMFEPIFSELPGLTGDWQVVLNKKDNKDLIEFRVESANGSLDANSVKQGIFSGIKNSLPDSWRMYEMGLFHFEANILPKGSLRQSRKLIRIVDQRKF